MNALGSLQSAQMLVANISRSNGRLAITLSKPAPVQIHEVAAGSGKSPAQSSSVAFESIYSVNHVDANKLKINLMERVGKAFGFDINKVESVADMAGQIEKILEQMEKDLGSNDAAREIRKIEKDLGLDELGMSLRDVLKAMKDPDSSENKKLMELLADKAGEPPRTPAIDEIGLYRP